jgi:RNA polymerase sigma factor (sigma-70 family)
MPRPRKHEGLHDRQSAYHQTEKGKEAIKKYEASEAAKARKRRWWKENKAKDLSDRHQRFLETYGDVDTALTPLDATERQVIQLYFGLVEGDCLTLQEIGEKLNCSKQRISQIKSKALKKLTIAV